MDELQAVRAFKSDVAGAHVTDQVGTRTRAVVALQIEQEQHPRKSSAKRHPLSRPLIASLIGLALAGGAIGFAHWNHGPTLTDQAMAAIGSAPVLHIVGVVPTGDRIVDVASGASGPVLQTEEIWFNEDDGLLRDTVRVRGAVVEDVLQTPKGGTTGSGRVYDCSWIAAHPVEATQAGVSCSQSGENGTAPRTVAGPAPTIDPGLAGFADGYRQALSSGAAREAGSSELDGQTVDWLALTTSHGDERVALDRATHKPVFLSGPETYSMTITTIETTSPATATFSNPQPAATDEPVKGTATDGTAVALDAESLNRAFNGASWLGEKNGDLSLVSATGQQVTTSYAAKPAVDGIGLKLEYGTLRNGTLDTTQPFVVLSEASSRDLAYGFGWGAVRGAAPTPGEIYLPNGSAGATIGYIVVAGRFVTVEASAPDLLTKASKALQRAVA